MARILITGSNGFTGQYLVDRLARDGHELFGIVHSDNGANSCSLCRGYTADLRDLNALTRIIAEVQPERVLHLAAIANVAHGDVSELYSSNILGTRHLLHALSSSDRVPSAVLLASSANIYGNRRAGVLREDMDPAPANDYGITKVACELLGRAYADRLPIITVRPFNYTGRGQSQDFLIPKIIAHMRRRASVIELGNIHIARDFSDVRTVVDVYARLLNRPEAIGRTVNVCSGRTHTLSDVLDLAAGISGHGVEVVCNPSFVRSDEVKTLCGSRRQLDDLIGIVPMPELAETLRWMLED